MKKKKELEQTNRSEMELIRLDNQNQQKNNQENEDKFGGPGESQSVVLPNQNPTNNNITNIIPIKNPEHIKDNPKSKSEIKDISDKEENDRKKNIYIQKNKKIQMFFNIFHFILILMTFISFQLNIFSVRGINSTEISYFSEIINNWFSSPITNLTLKCDDIHTKFISDYWQGTSAGCICGNDLTRGSCTNKGNIGMRFDCKDIPAINSMHYHLWKNTKICAERIPGVYFDMNITSNPNECSENLKSCGIVDSENNYLCYDKNKPCPFNKFSRDITQRNLKDDFVLNFNNSDLVFGRENTNDKILFFLKVAFDKPCLNPFFDNLNFPVYMLNFFKDKQFCYPFSDLSIINKVSYEDNYILIDKYSGEKLYKENGFIDKINKLPQYDKIEYQKDINLYGRNYFGLKIKCFNKIKSENKNIQLMLDLNNFIKNEGHLDALIFGVFIEIILLVTIIIMICVFNRQTIYIGRIQSTDMNCYNYLFLFNFILLIIYFGVALSTTNSMLISKTIRYIFSSEECVDIYTITIFDKIISVLDNSKNFFFGLVILISFQIIIWFSFVCYSYTALNKIDFYEI